jgi:hypothetical protein
MAVPVADTAAPVVLVAAVTDNLNFIEYNQGLLHQSNSPFKLSFTFKKHNTKLSQ